MTTAASSSVFLLPPPQLRRIRCKCTTLLCNKATSFLLRISPPSSQRRLRLEQIGGVKKKWSDLGSLNYWVVKDYYRLVNSVNAFEPHIQKLCDELLRAKTVEFPEPLSWGATQAKIQAGNLEIGNGYGVPGGGAYSSLHHKQTIEGKDLDIQKRSQNNDEVNGESGQQTMGKD